MKNVKKRPVTRQKITIQANVWQHTNSIELGKYHQSIESYLEGVCASFTIYKGKDATQWLNSYLNSFKPTLLSSVITKFVGPTKYAGPTVYIRNEANPDSVDSFKKYQEFGSRLWKDQKAKKILLDFLESGEAEYKDAIIDITIKLKSLPNWGEICGEVYSEIDKPTTINPLMGEIIHSPNKEEVLVECTNPVNQESDQSISPPALDNIVGAPVKTFSEYITEEYRENALPYLTERYTNAAPGMIWRMLIAVTDLGIVAPRILNMTDDKLLSILESQFSKIGKNGRRSFNSAKNTYNCPGEKQIADIQATKNKIIADLNISRI